jgi:hypothetical protein
MKMKIILYTAAAILTGVTSMLLPLKLFYTANVELQNARTRPVIAHPSNMLFIGLSFMFSFVFALIIALYYKEIHYLN